MVNSRSYMTVVTVGVKTKLPRFTLGTILNVLSLDLLYGYISKLVIFPLIYV